MTGRRLLLTALFALSWPQGNADSQPRIAIIIDDLGYQLEAGRRAISLPGPLAFAVLPFTPHGQRLAQFANDRGREVLLHLPLESVDHRGPTEPGGITLDMSRTAFNETFSAAIDALPFAVGVSSHRGSLLTRHPGHMSWLMQEIGAREGLFFIDSYTTHESVALMVAAEAGVVAARRDVFLDHDRSEEAVMREFRRLKSLARENGHAVAIGHPFPETLDVLERELPKLEAEGFDVVTISQIMRQEGNRI
jgi:polysaccharide deacetylase 2 family uncharacterized protein YibQ